jgi:adhesin HecA-like repeat protein
MSIERVQPAGLFPDPPYAYASVVAAGSLVFTAGACPLDADGKVVGAGDVALQADQAVRNLFRTLEAAGSSPGSVVKTTIFVASANQADLVRAWDVVKAAFGDHDPPSTLLGVAQLGYSGQLVEIEAIATTEHPAGAGREGLRAT